MSEGSLPPFGLSGPVPGALKRMLGRLFGRPRRPVERPAQSDPELASRAGAIIGRHAGEHATLFERAERLAARACRLQESGTPSESADNRAARARQEVEDSLAALRDGFVASEGPAGGDVFDREVVRLFPALRPHGLTG